MIEEGKLNKIIKRIENDRISSFFGDDDSDSNNMDYSSDSTLEFHDLPDECKSIFTGPRVEIAFAARTSPTLLQINTLKQKHQIKQEDTHDPQKIDDNLVQSELIKINDEIKLMEEIKTQEEHAQTYIGNHRSTLKQLNNTIGLLSNIFILYSPPPQKYTIFQCYMYVYFTSKKYKRFGFKNRIYFIKLHIIQSRKFH